MDWNWVPGFLLTAITGALSGLGAVLLATLTKLPDKLLNHAFERKLETFKSGLTGEIEQLKSRLNHLGDRGIRSNERE